MKVTMKTVFSDPAFLIAYGFGSGLAPKAPGTFGSALALWVFIPFLNTPIYVQIGIVLVGLLAGILITDHVARVIQIKDPAPIVWDEFVGMWIVMLWLPSIWWLVPAFVLFRLFDILKPWPVSLADRRIEGGLGIMCDDVLAGLYGLATLQLCYYLMQLGGLI